YLSSFVCRYLLNLRSFPTRRSSDLLRLLSETGRFGISAATNSLIRAMLRRNNSPKGAYGDVTASNSVACARLLARCARHFQGPRRRNENHCAGKPLESDADQS